MTIYIIETLRKKLKYSEVRDLTEMLQWPNTASWE